MTGVKLQPSPFTMNVDGHLFNQTLHSIHFEWCVFCWAKFVFCIVGVVEYTQLGHVCLTSKLRLSVGMIDKPFLPISLMIDEGDGV